MAEFETRCREARRTYDLFSQMFDQTSSPLGRKIEILERTEDKTQPFVKQPPFSLVQQTLSFLPLQSRRETLFIKISKRRLDCYTR